MNTKSPKKKWTLKDIAAEFQVSISTVSKCIHNSNEISDVLKLKVQAFAKEVNYRATKEKAVIPDVFTKTIAVMVPNMLNYFFTQVFTGVEKVASEAGYNLINCISDESYNKEINTLKLLSSGAIQGLIVSMAAETQAQGKSQHFVDLQRTGVPVVMIDRVSNEVKCDKVIVDDEQAAYHATKYLINTACKNVAIVTSISRSSVGQLRVNGYKKALEEFQIAYDDNLIVSIKKDDDLGVLMTLLLHYKTIHGIIVLDENTAVQVLQIVKSRGFSVPEDISIIGFTNGIMSKNVTPALTTVSQHGMFLGETAAQLLIQKLENKADSKTFITRTIKTSLIVRDSTKKL